MVLRFHQKWHQLSFFVFRMTSSIFHHQNDFSFDSELNGYKKFELTSESSFLEENLENKTRQLCWNFFNFSLKICRFKALMRSKNDVSDSRIPDNRVKWPSASWESWAISHNRSFAIINFQNFNLRSVKNSTFLSDSISAICEVIAWLEDSQEFNIFNKQTNIFVYGSLCNAW